MCSVFVEKKVKSAEDTPQVVKDYLDARGVVLGPFMHEEIRQVQMRVIPNASQPGKWHLIVDLSHPEGKNMNDGINPELCFLHYVKVDDVERMIWQLGPGTQMAKIDIKSSYRIVLAHSH